MPLNIYLACRSIEQTQNYYRALPGFETFDSKMNTCTVQYEDCSFIFFESGPEDPTPNFTGTFYLFVSNVDSCWASIQAKSTQEEPLVEWPLQNMSYGTREFAIRDCNGYRLAFAQSNNS